MIQRVKGVMAMCRNRPPRVMSVGPWRWIPKNAKQLDCFFNLFFRAQKKNQKRFNQHLSNILYMYVFVGTPEFMSSWFMIFCWDLQKGKSDELTMCLGDSQLSAPSTDLGKRTRWLKATEAHVDACCNGGVPWSDIFIIFVPYVSETC